MRTTLYASRSSVILKRVGFLFYIHTKQWLSNQDFPNTHLFLILRNVYFQESEARYTNGTKRCTMVLSLDSSEFAFLMELLPFRSLQNEKLLSQNKNNPHEICRFILFHEEGLIFQMKMHFFAPSENCSRRQDIFLMNGNTGMTILDRVISVHLPISILLEMFEKSKKYSQILVRKSKYLKWALMNGSDSPGHISSLITGLFFLPCMMLFLIKKNIMSWGVSYFEIKNLHKIWRFFIRFPISGVCAIMLHLELLV